MMNKWLELQHLRLFEVSAEEMLRQQLKFREENRTSEANTWEMSHFIHAETVYLCVFVLAYRTDCIFNFCFAQEPIIEPASVKFTDAKL